jgi:hypothetical protein
MASPTGTSTRRLVHLTVSPSQRCK